MTEVELEEPTKTLSDGAFRQIQSAIVKGDIAPGTRISEQYLSTTFGIGRGPHARATQRPQGKQVVLSAGR